VNARQIRDKAAKQDDSKSLLRDLVDRTVEHRCSICNHKLGVGQLGECTILEIKCSKCGAIVTIGVQKEM
jgi:hypothetical protein